MKSINLFIFNIIFIFCFGHVGYAQTAPDEIVQGPFKTDLYPEGKIYFEKINNEKIIDNCRNVAFMLEYK